MGVGGGVGVGVCGGWILVVVVVCFGGGVVVRVGVVFVGGGSVEVAW